MPADDQLRADLADFTLRLAERIERLEAEIEQARRIASSAIDLAGELAAELRGRRAA